MHDVMTPCKLSYGKIPDYAFLRVFGSQCFPYTWPYVAQNES